MRTLGALLLPFLITTHIDAFPWRSAGPGNARVNALVQSQVNPDVFYVGSAAGVFRSGDRGATWTDITGPLTDVIALTTDPADAETLYALRRTNIDPDGSYNRPPHVFRTRDGGAHWDALTVGPATYPFIRPTALLIDPRSPNVLYLGSACEIDGWCAAGGVYKSTNSGATWAKLSGPTWAAALSLDAASPDTLYISDSIHGNGRSDDGGATWTWDRTTVFPSRIVVADPRDSRRRYGIGTVPFLMISNDEGRHWSGDEVRLLSESTIPRWLDAVLATDPMTGRVFLGTSAGFHSADGSLFRSGDGGTRFLEIGSLGKQPITAMVFDAATRELTIGTPSGLYRTANLGADWTELSFARGTAVRKVVEQPGKPGTLYALGLGLLFRSDNFGQHWTVAGDPIEAGSNVDRAANLAVDVAGNVYVALLNSRRVLKLSAETHQWIALQVSPTVPVPLTASFLVADPNAPRTVYALSGVFLGPAIGVTRDGGTTWERMPTPVQYESMTIHPSGRMYGSTEKGVYRSDDAGATWLPLLNDVLIASEPALSASAPDVVTVLARTSNLPGRDYRIHRSEDGGATWTAVQPRMDDGSLIDFTADQNGIVADPRDARILCAITPTRVIRSHDGGTTWFSFSDGLVSPPSSIAVDGAFVYVGTDRGVWELPLQTRRR